MSINALSPSPSFSTSSSCKTEHSLMDSSCCLEEEEEDGKEVECRGSSCFVLSLQLIEKKRKIIEKNNCHKMKF